MEIFTSIKIVFNIIKGPSFMEQAWGPHVLIFDIWDDMFTINLMLNSLRSWRYLYANIIHTNVSKSYND